MREFNLYRSASILVAGFAAFTAATVAVAAPVIVGNGGFGTSNGVVGDSPVGANYSYVSTFGGTTGVGQIAGVGGVNGSTFTSDAFTANAGEALTFYFNFVTADGAGFSDYAWAGLLGTMDDTVLDYIFSARTTTSGDTVPGFGLPGLNATLTPGSTPIIPGGPVWAELGNSSGGCYDTGCGYTGWIQATYIIGSTGTYRLGFGVTNTGDSSVDTGLAFAGAAINGTPVIPGGVPEPQSWVLLIAGFGLVGAAARRRRSVVAA